MLKALASLTNQELFIHTPLHVHHTLVPKKSKRILKTLQSHQGGFHKWHLYTCLPVTSSTCRSETVVPLSYTKIAGSSSTTISSSAAMWKVACHNFRTIVYSNTVTGIPKRRCVPSTGQQYGPLYWQKKRITHANIQRSYFIVQPLFPQVMAKLNYTNVSHDQLHPAQVSLAPFYEPLPHWPLFQLHQFCTDALHTRRLYAKPVTKTIAPDML